jgi:hypothetical protein
MVAQGPADQDKGRQKEGVGCHHPLGVDRRCAQTALYGRQRHGESGLVDEGHARSENGRRQDPWCGVRGTDRLPPRRADYPLVARLPDYVGHWSVSPSVLPEPAATEAPCAIVPSTLAALLRGNAA